MIFNEIELDLVSLPILILGESGTGKTHLARDLHLQSSQKSEKFLSFNLATATDNLLASELFGHIKGSFTDAQKDRFGFCHEVGQGTLFLDEVGELSLEGQKKILQLIDEKTYLPVGSCEQKKFRGKLILATNKDLEMEVKLGKFRSDLYFRLQSFQIQMKPLRDDKKLLSSLIFQFSKVHLRADQSLAFELKNFLYGFYWPGNIRQLRNLFQYFGSLKTPLIELKDCPTWLVSKPSGIVEMEENYYLALENFEKRYFEYFMKLFRGRINYGCEKMGISKTTLITKTKKYGINTGLLRYNCEVKI